MRGYYALPVPWGEEMVGWCNVSVVDERLKRGFAGGRPRSASFERVFEEELCRARDFLGWSKRDFTSRDA